MLFNSLVFALFVPIVFGLYWSLPKKPLMLQNVLILVASYIFYGWWDIRFLALIAISSCVDFLIGILLERTQVAKYRLTLLWLSISVNLGILGFFKYFNFFVDSLIDTFSLFGVSLDPITLSIVLPVGISFYTFQTMTYTIDIYYKRIKATNDPIAFFAFVSFFPQLVAGPIERASNLLPQFLKTRVFSYEQSMNGMHQILWGLFKKIVVADTAAIYVNEIFANPELHGGSTLALGAVLFAVQIYCDFSGYSDIAIGTAHLFGFNLMQNFNYPYFATSIGDFWRRWHISLSSWFKDYVYIPLGGSRHGMTKTVRNISIVFIISGLWHGANWTFLAWGALHGLFLITSVMVAYYVSSPVAVFSYIPLGTRKVLSICTTFTLVSFAWIFFRAENLDSALLYIRTMFSEELFSVPHVPEVSYLGISGLLVLIVTLFTCEWFSQNKPHPLAKLPLPFMMRGSIYITLACTVCLFASLDTPSSFIYFQF